MEMAHNSTLGCWWASWEVPFYSRLAAECSLRKCRVTCMCVIHPLTIRLCVHVAILVCTSTSSSLFLLLLCAHGHQLPWCWASRILSGPGCEAGIWGRSAAHPALPPYGVRWQSQDQRTLQDPADHSQWDGGEQRVGPVCCGYSVSSADETFVFFIPLPLSLLLCWIWNLPNIIKNKWADRHVLLRCGKCSTFA